MKSVAFIFKTAPHGDSAGREGLDALLATSNYTENVAAFFLSDGIFQLLPEQHPEGILARNYISTFKILSLYDIEECYVCQEDIQVRGVPIDTEFIIDTSVIPAALLREKLSTFDVVLSF